jgi:hypothetical protein
VKYKSSSRGQEQQADHGKCVFRITYYFVMRFLLSGVLILASRSHADGSPACMLILLSKIISGCQTLRLFVELRESSQFPTAPHNKFYHRCIFKVIISNYERHVSIELKITRRDYAILNMMVLGKQQIIRAAMP